MVALVAAGCAGYTPYETVLLERTKNLHRIDGHWVYVEDLGHGEPILLLHGFGASTYSWRHVMPELARDHRVIAIDLHGFGWTERPRSDAAYSRDGQAKLVLSVLDDLGIRSVDLVGHSYGGAIALAVAARSPARVRSLVLVDAARPIYTQQRRYPGTEWPLVPEIVVRSILRPRVVGDGLRRSVVNDGVITDEVVREYYDRLAVEGVYFAYEALTRPAPPTEPEPVLSEIETPSLVLWGEEDGSIGVDYGRALAEELPNARFEVIPDAGHMPMEERPDEVERRIREFLESRVAAGASADRVTAGASFR